MIFGDSETDDGKVLGNGVAEVEAVACASIPRGFREPTA